MVLTFAVLMVASVVFLVRSFNQKSEKRDDEQK
jgi:Na+/H+ antiporter NhaC